MTQKEQKSLIRWYGDEAMASEYDFVAYRSTGQLSEVVSTLLPEEKRKQITNRLNNTFQLYGQEFVDDLIPLIQQTLNQAVPQIEKGFRESIARNERKIDEMLNRWNTQYFEPGRSLGKGRTAPHCATSCTTGGGIYRPRTLGSSIAMEILDGELP